MTRVERLRRAGRLLPAARRARATRSAATLPGPAPALGDPPGRSYYEIPIAIQDRSFNDDGSLFYPDNRAFFEGLDPSQLQIPFMPDPACDGPSDISPIWNPEFFGNTMVVNGNTWPFLEVEQRRYRFRLLNGCNSRFLILKLEQRRCRSGRSAPRAASCPQPVELDRGPARPGRARRRDRRLHQRAGRHRDSHAQPRARRAVRRRRAGRSDFEPADPATTGQVMQLRGRRRAPARHEHPAVELVLPALAPLGAATPRASCRSTRRTPRPCSVSTEDGNVVLDCAGGEPFGPRGAILGTLNADGSGYPLGWDEPITENPAVGATEVWELHNFTADAHPIHIHEITFEVVNRQPFDGSAPCPGELGARSQGHRDRLPRRDHAREGALRPRRPLRLALPHRRARGQRDDAALPDRALALPNSVLALSAALTFPPPKEKRRMRVPRRMSTSRALTEPWSPGFGSLGRDERRGRLARWRFGRSGRSGIRTI